MTPALRLQVQRVRTELVDYLQRFELEIAAESTPRHLQNVGRACELLLEKLIRIQGHETIETRALEERIARLTRQGRALWEPCSERKSERPSLRIVQ